MKRRPAQPTGNALARRKDGVNRSYTAHVIPADLSAEQRRAIVIVRVGEPLLRARIDFLKTVEALAPEVLRTLADTVTEGDEDALCSWAQRWNLDAPWTLTAARNTLMLWAHWPRARGERWDLNLADGWHRLPMRGRFPARPAEILIRADHLEWLVRHCVLGEKFATITTPRQTSQKAVKAVSRLLGLPEK